MTKEYKEVLELMKAKRNDAGYTQAEIADMLGLAKITYQRYESGVNEMPLQIYMQVAKILDIHLVAKSELMAPKEETAIITSVRDLNDLGKKIDNVEGNINEKLDELLKLFKKKK